MEKKRIKKKLKKGQTDNRKKLTIRLSEIYIQNGRQTD